MARKADTPEQIEEKRLFREQQMGERVRKNKLSQASKPVQQMAEPINPVDNNPAPAPDLQPQGSGTVPPNPPVPPSTTAPAADSAPEPSSQPAGNPVPTTDFNPITADSLVQRAYSTPPPLAEGTSPIAEPIFDVPKMDPTKPPASVLPPGPGATAGATPGATPLPQNPIIPPNSDWAGLGQAEKTQRATQAVDLTLGGYDKLHQLGRYIVIESDEKLDEKCRDGKLSRDIEIPMDAEGRRTSTLEVFVSDFNKQATKALTLEQKFIDEVRPAMIRVYEKNGWGASDEIFLMAKFGEDIAVKVSIAVGLKKGLNKHLGYFQEYYQKKLVNLKGHEQHVADEPEEKIANTPPPAPAAEKPAEQDPELNIVSQENPALPEKQD